jgi:hypothetical protein
MAELHSSAKRRIAEGFANGGSVQSAIVRSGSYAYRANPVNSNRYIAFASRSAGGVVRQIFSSSRFYLYVAQLPLNGSVSIVKVGGAETLNPEVDLNWDGTLTLADAWYPVLVRSQKALTPDGLWHRIEFDGGNSPSVYVDGVLWASSNRAYAAGTSMSFGAGGSPTFINAITDLYFDDVLVDGGSFSKTGFPGDGHVVLLKPMGDPAALNSWTGGAGSSSSLWMPVRNVPAAGCLLPAPRTCHKSRMARMAAISTISPWFRVTPRQGSRPMQSSMPLCQCVTTDRRVIRAPRNPALYG